MKKSGLSSLKKKMLYVDMDSTSFFMVNLRFGTYLLYRAGTIFYMGSRRISDGFPCTCQFCSAGKHSTLI